MWLKYLCIGLIITDMGICIGVSNYIAAGAFGMCAFLAICLAIEETYEEGG